MAEDILYRVSDGVATIRFNRPERNNAMTQAMRDAYFDRLDEAAADPDVRAIVVTGEGKSFCVGADMEALGEIDPDNPPQLFDRTRPHTYATRIPKPIIAAINGPCAGLGLVHALSCDLRFAAAGVKLTTAFARRGLVAEYGISWLLPRLVGTSRAFDLIVSGRVFLAEEAEQLGVVDRVAPGDELLEEATAYARDLAQNCSPTSMAVMKKQLQADLEGDLDAAYARALTLIEASVRRPDVVEGVKSFVERRAPQFPPLDASVLE